MIEDECYLRTLDITNSRRYYDNEFCRCEIDRECLLKNKKLFLCLQNYHEKVNIDAFQNIDTLSFVECTGEIDINKFEKFYRLTLYDCSNIKKINKQVDIFELNLVRSAIKIKNCDVFGKIHKLRIEGNVINYLPYGIKELILHRDTISKIVNLPSSIKIIKILKRTCNGQSFDIFNLKNIHFGGIFKNIAVGAPFI